MAHGVRVVVRRPIGAMVEVVELADRRDPGHRHLLVGGACQVVVRVGVEALRDAVHGVPPGPERPPLALRPAAQRAMEGMAVTVRQPGDRQAVKSGGFTLRLVPAHCRDPIAVDVYPDGGGDVRWSEPGTLAPVRRHADSSRSTLVKASTPARQSAVSANSSGECDTPVGLRTNNIADGMPASCRIAAS